MIAATSKGGPAAALGFGARFEVEDGASLLARALAGLGLLTAANPASGPVANDAAIGLEFAARAAAGEVSETADPRPAAGCTGAELIGVEFSGLTMRGVESLLLASDELESAGAFVFSGAVRSSRSFSLAED